MKKLRKHGQLVAADRTGVRFPLALGLQHFNLREQLLRNREEEDFLKVCDAEAWKHEDDRKH